MDKVDIVYQKLLKDILENGTSKSDRTGTGTISVFSREVRFKMSDGFPLLTTKKMYMKGIVHELLWFLNGDTNIKYLVDNGVHIWDGDAYKHYKSEFEKGKASGTTQMVKKLNGENKDIILSEADFIDMIKNCHEYGSESFAKKWGDLGPIYGKQWVNWGGYFSAGHADRAGNMGVHFKGINQIANLINELKNNPDSRRLIVNAWNVGEIKDMVLPPCHYGFELNTRELNLDERAKLHPNPEIFYDINGTFSISDSIENSNFQDKDWLHEQLDKGGIPRRAISLKWIQRSVDTFLGLPFNIASYALLLHMIAKEVNMVPDELIGSLGDVHIYKNHIDQVNELLSREPRDLPTLTLENVDNIFTYCYENVKISNYDPHPAIIAKLSN